MTPTHTQTAPNPIRFDILATDPESTTGVQEPARIGVGVSFPHPHHAVVISIEGATTVCTSIDEAHTAAESHAPGAHFEFLDSTHGADAVPNDYTT